MSKEQPSKISYQSLILPTKPYGSLYTIEEANKLQQHIVFLVLDTLKNWVAWTADPSTIKHTPFKPLQLTVRGMAGSGENPIYYTF